MEELYSDFRDLLKEVTLEQDGEEFKCKILIRPMDVVEKSMCFNTVNMYGHFKFFHLTLTKEERLKALVLSHEMTESETSQDFKMFSTALTYLLEAVAHIPCDIFRHEHDKEKSYVDSCLEILGHYVTEHEMETIHDEAHEILRIHYQLKSGETTTLIRTSLGEN